MSRPQISWDEPQAQQPAIKWDEPSVESPIPPPAIGKPTAPKMEQSLAGSLMSGDVQGPPMPDRGGRSMAEDIGRHPKTAEAAGALSLAGGLAGAGALASPIVAPAARFAGKVMAKYPLSTYAGIEVAKRLPGIGPMLDKLPGIEYLPFLAGKGEAPGTSRIGRIGRAASGEEAAVAAKPVSIGKPSAPTPRTPQLTGNTAIEGEYLPPEETPTAPVGKWANSRVVQPKQIPSEASPVQSLPYRRIPGEVTPEDVSAPNPNVLAGPRGSRGIRVPQPIPQRALPAYEAPEVKINAPWRDETPSPAPVNIGKPSWTPPRAQSTWPPPGSPADLAETKDIAASVRDQSSRELGALRAKGNEEGYARNTRQGPSKGQLTGTATRPVKYTKTPGVKVSGTTPPAPGSDELLPLLEKSLELAKKAKGR